MNIAIIIIGLLALIGSIFAIIECESNGGKILSTIALVAGVALIILGSAFVIIPTGSTGVRVTFGQVDETSIQTGFNWKTPFVQSIKKVNNKLQDKNYAKDFQIWGETKEKTPIYGSVITVSYKILGEGSVYLYTNVTDYDSNLIDESMLASSFKDASVLFPAETVTIRSNIEPATAQKLQEALNNKYGENVVYITKVVINDMDFEQGYNDAIAAKSLAQKAQETQTINNQTEITKAEAAAQVKKTTAQGEADAALIKAQADSAANKLISDSITPQLLDKMEREARLAHGWVTIQSGAVITDATK